ncbi:MAG: hypothetical protein J1F13_04950 [Prevotellaceae bacterium]|nr:hypothetical protein [Prevotellaceae bacterium]
MKKTYLTPVINTVKMTTMQVMAASIKGYFEDGITIESEDQVFSKETDNNFWE